MKHVEMHNRQQDPLPASSSIYEDPIAKYLNRNNVTTRQ